MAPCHYSIMQTRLCYLKYKTGKNGYSRWDFHIDDLKGGGEDRIIDMIIKGLEAAFGKFKTQTHTR